MNQPNKHKVYFERFNQFLGDEWFNQMKDGLLSPRIINCLKQIKNKETKDKKLIYPTKEIRFKAFTETPFDKVKVVWLGLEPYKNKGEANGLSFAIDNKCLIVPKTLQEIHEEVERDIYGPPLLDFDYSLANWTKQGVFLINSALTVEAKRNKSHIDIWTDFTKLWISAINKKQDVIWVLLGKNVQKYEQYITNKSHFIIKEQHPSIIMYDPKAVGIRNTNIFSRVNYELRIRNIKEIIW